MPDEPLIHLDAAQAAVDQYKRIAEAAIRDAANWLRKGALIRAIPDALPDAIMVVDTGGIIVSVNSRFELMFGYHRSEVVGQTPEMLIPESARLRHTQLRQEYSDNPRVRDMSADMKLHGRRKNGSEISVMVKLGPVVIPSGTYTIVIIRKIQE